MTYPGLNYSHSDMRELRQIEHEENHIGENIFEDGCNWCNVEKCDQCKGRGMSENGKLVCGRCDGRGRII